MSKCRLLLASALILGVLHASRPCQASYDDDDGPHDDSKRPKNAELGVGVRFKRQVDQPSMLVSHDMGGVFAFDVVEHGRFGKYMAMECGVGAGMGTDSRGYRRYDIDFAMPTFITYLTPKSRAQLYTLLGFTMNTTWFDRGPDGVIPGAPVFMFAGGVAGLGIEVRESKSMAIRFELTAYWRHRFTVEKRDKPTLDSNPQLEEGTRVVKGIGFTGGFVFF